MIARRWLLLVGLVLLIVVVVPVIFAPVFSSIDPTFVPRGQSLSGPSARHWFGTDVQGRDLFARVLYGGRTSIVVAFVSAVIVVMLAIGVGCLAAIRRGLVASLVIRLSQIVFVIPLFVFASVMVLVVGRGTAGMILAISLASWPQGALLFKSAMDAVLCSPYVEAARSGGVANREILRVHVIPRVGELAVSLFTLTFTIAVLTESSLSFLGLGVSEPTPSWGGLIAAGRRFAVTNPHVLLFPVLALGLVTLAMVLVREGLRPSEDLESGAVS